MMETLNKNDIKFIADHCKNVYKDEHKFPFVWKNLTHFEDGNINGYSFEFMDVTYIFIAGTDEFKDVLADLKFPLCGLDEESMFTRVHLGFLT